MLFACVLAGGKGERFWPLSREERPKQLTDLTGEGTLLRLTVERLLPLVPAERILVVTSGTLAGAVAAELPELPVTNVIAEPVGRNSAPAIGLAARWFASRDPDASFLVAPSDHVIDGAAFRRSVEAAATFAAAQPMLVTFGLAPTRPETAYGYVERGEKLDGAIHRAVSFREKPDAATARALVDAGRFYWNSGMFVWKASTILDAFRRHLPEVRELLERVDIGADGTVAPEALHAYYEGCPSISIDYGVMEKADNVAVNVADFRWCDVGSWSALGDVMPADDAGNVRFGVSHLRDVRDSIAYTDGGPIAMVGLEGVVVVRVGEVTLVCPKHRAEEVRELVQELRERPEWKPHL